MDIFEGKIMKWDDDWEVTDSKCSSGWMSSTLKVHDMYRVKLHGEYDNMTDEEVGGSCTPS